MEELRGYIFRTGSCMDKGGFSGANFRKAYEAEIGRRWDWRDEYDAVRTDPAAIKVVKRMSDDGPDGPETQWESRGNVGIAWIPQDLIEYAEVEEDDCGREYLTLGITKILKQLLEQDPNDSKQVERLQGIGKRIVACDIKYEYYVVK